MAPAGGLEEGWRGDLHPRGTLDEALIGGQSSSPHREFNHQNGVTVADKAFYNRLARPSFSKFMSWDVRSARREPEPPDTHPGGGQTAVARFKDIVIRDDSSFALKKLLRDAFPGRFTTTDPAAVELHATYSGLFDDVSRVQLAPDKEAERQFLPEPSTLRGSAELSSS